MLGLFSPSYLHEIVTFWKSKRCLILSRLFKDSFSELPLPVLIQIACF